MSIDSFKLSYSDESGAHDLFFQKKEAAPSEDCITIGNTSYTVLSPIGISSLQNKFLTRFRLMAPIRL